MSDTGNGEKQDTGQKVQDQPLTIREHLDPDKHWIGETLAPPTQTEIAGTVGNTSSPGDSPFVARADHLHKLGNDVVTDANIASGIFNNFSIQGIGITLQDDQAAYIQFGVGIQAGLACFACHTPSFSAIVSFRTGDTNASALVVGATNPSTTTAGIGALTGTSGTDGHFTIRGWNSATASRLYIENRVGSVRIFYATFISLASGLVPGAWVVV